MNKNPQNPTEQMQADTAQAQQEPVAWMYEWNGRTHITTADQRPIEHAHPHFKKSKPLYAAPQPHRQPLTEDQLRDALRQCPHDTAENLRVRWLYAKDFARAVEAAHGIGGTHG